MTKDMNSNIKEGQHKKAKQINSYLYICYETIEYQDKKYS